MTKEQQIEELKKLWVKRNPCHDLNADSGEDMFWGTVLCIFNDLNKVNQEQPVKEIEDICDCSGSRTGMHSQFCNMQY